MDIRDEFIIRNSNIGNNLTEIINSISQIKQKFKTTSDEQPLVETLINVDVSLQKIRDYLKMKTLN